MLSPLAKKNVEKFRQPMDAGGASENTPKTLTKLSKNAKAQNDTARGGSTRRGKKRRKCAFLSRQGLVEFRIPETLHIFGVLMSCTVASYIPGCLCGRLSDECCDYRHGETLKSSPLCTLRTLRVVYLGQELRDGNAGEWSDAANHFACLSVAKPFIIYCSVSLWCSVACSGGWTLPEIHR
jgi:hypothetical protein